MKKPLILLITILLLTLGLRPPTGQAQEALAMEVVAGLDSFAKANLWGPLRVTLTNEGADLTAEIRVEDSSYWNADTLYTTPVELPGQSRKQIELYLPFGGQDRLDVELVDAAGETLLTRQVTVQTLTDTDFLVGVVAGDPSLLNGLGGITAPNNGRVGVAHLAISDLPATVQGWTALDMLVVNDIDTGQLTPPQREALAHWVSLGGRLVVGGGPNALQTLAGLTELLPFSGIESETLPHPLPALAAYAGASLEDRGPYVAALPQNPTGKTVVSEAEQPLIVSAKRDLGEVYYLAFDLGLAPLDTLAARPRFFPRLTGQFTPNLNHLDARLNRSEFRSSLTMLPSQTLPTPGTIALYLLAYVLVVGPLNYFVLRWLKRREWAWLSLPLIVLLFCGVGYVGGFQLRGGGPLLRQISLLHSQAGSPLAEATTFIGVYSPNRTSYTLELADTALVSRLSDNNALTTGLTVSTGHSTTISDLQADIGGMPAVMAHSQTAAPAVSATLTVDRRNNRLYGTLTNQTGQPISHAALIFEDQSVAVGPLPPGETKIDDRLMSYNTYSNFYDIPANAGPTETIDLISRDIAVRAILNSNYYYPNNQTSLTGLYLVGWQSGSPVQVALAGYSGQPIEDTLLLVGLPYERE